MWRTTSSMKNGFPSVSRCRALANVIATGSSSCCASASISHRTSSVESPRRRMRSKIRSRRRSASTDANGCFRSVGDGWPQRFDERQVRQSALGLDAFAEEDAGAAKTRERARLLGEASLADSGLTREHDERALAAERAVDRLLQSLELGGAA